MEMGLVTGIVALTVMSLPTLFAVNAGKADELVSQLVYGGAQFVEPLPSVKVRVSWLAPIPIA
jgi:hypothetical protein